MATKKIYDLAVKVGQYTDSNGETKNRYVSVGRVMQRDDGGKFLMIDRTFNPAGVPNPENRDSVVVSMFEARDGQQQAPAQQRPAQQQSRPPMDPTPADDPIPF